MKYGFSLLIYIIFSFSSFGQLKAYLTYSAFFSPENGPYLETYLSVIGNSVKYKKNQSGNFVGSIEITMLFRLGEEIKNFKKYNLSSPEISDSSQGINFIDQQRFLLPPGTYNFELSVSDNNSSDAPYKSNQPVQIYSDSGKMFFSDLEILESFKPSSEKGILSKSGFDLVPYVSNFFPKSMEKISFYGELYNGNRVLGMDEKFLVNYFIESFENGTSLPNFRGFLRQSANPVNVILNSIGISALPSGNYNLVLEARNKNNILLTEKRFFFQRSNPDLQMKPEDISNQSVTGTFVDQINNSDSLAEYIRSLRPISSETEIRFVENNFSKTDSGTLPLMKKFFLNFWVERNSIKPETEWDEYKNKVAIVNKAFGTKIKKGYETDRGRIYLKYGPPNSLIDRPIEPSNYPYQVWHYYKTERRGNSKFVFFNPDEITNDYQLLHSNVIGEVSDFRWQYRLQKRNNPSTNLDENKGDEHFGSRPEDFWNNPR